MFLQSILFVEAYCNTTIDMKIVIKIHFLKNCLTWVGAGLGGSVFMIVL